LVINIAEVKQRKHIHKSLLPELQYEKNEIHSILLVHYILHPYFLINVSIPCKSKPLALQLTVYIYYTVKHLSCHMGLSHIHQLSISAGHISGSFFCNSSRIKWSSVKTQHYGLPDCQKVASDELVLMENYSGFLWTENKQSE